jgi:predicted ArsR family transcriptional regulator
MTTTGSALDNIPATRRRILELVKKAGESRAEEIAANLGISVQGTRQHLSSLERDGLIEHREQRDGLGRPKYLFALTPAGDGLFPRNYADLTNELLEYVEDEDPLLLTRLFDRRAQRRLSAARRRMEGRPFVDRVRVLAEILDEDGYLADFEARRDGTYLITEHNCAVLSVALRYGHACGSELDFLRAAMADATVTRVAHRIAGGHVCSYLIEPNETNHG